MSIRESTWRALAAGALMLLSACGGGGGGGGGTESTLTPYTLSVTVSGLNGTVVLQNNGANNLSTSANASATFSATLVAGAAYNVTVLTQPAGQSCAVANGSGNMPAANVANVTVACTLVAPTLSLQPGVKQLQFTWAANPAATFYRVRENPDGSGYAQLGGEFATANYTLDLSGVLLSKRVNASYIIQSCNGFGCTDSAPVNLASQLVSLIGYFKASNTEANDAFGLSVALSANGGTLAVGASAEGSALTGVTAGAVSEGAALNGAPNSGAVYVFTRSGTTWAQEAYVKASNAGAGDRFGTSVTLSADGNTLAVGAFGESSALTGVTSIPIDDITAGNAATNSGAVYVFTRSGTAWSQQAYVKASNTGLGDQFGSSVALSADGNTLAVAAILEASVATGVNNTVPGQGDNAAPASGAAYVFTRSGGAWSQQAYIKASNSEAADIFGKALALSADGNTLAVGAFQEASSRTGVIAGAVSEATANNNANQSGAVYVFARSGVTWSQQAYVKASNSGVGDFFGWSAALSGDGNTLAVGAPQESSALSIVLSGPVSEVTAGNLAPQSGAVYMFARSGTAWFQQAYVKPSNAGAGDRFGTTVTLSGDGNTLAVGATNEFSAATGINGNQADNTLIGAGAAYLYTRSAGNWSQHTYVKASNTGSQGAVGDLFGIALALSGDGNTLAVSAFQEASAATGIGGNQADNSAQNSGAVYLY